MTIPVTTVKFADRSARATYVVQTFGEQLRGKTLDVGCDRALLHELRPDLEYTGIDIGGKPTITINLDETPRLPFDDGAFDTVVCTDVLEHLEHLHRTFDELVRVTKPGGHIIISLPSCWNNLRGRMRRGHGTPKYYGLPLDPPLDRHRWFMNLEDIATFMHGRAARQPIRVARMIANENPRASNLLDRLMYPSQRRYLNRYAHTLWTVLQKTGAGDTKV